MDYSYFDSIPLLIAATVILIVLFLRLRLPSVLGYLAVGVLVGPYGFGLITDTEAIRGLAEFGVVFLLFSIGLEFSLPLLLRMKGAVLGLGGAQVLLVTAVTAVVAVHLGVSVAGAIVLGGVVTMSSTALVTSQLSRQAELHSRHGLNAVGILLFQDVMVVPFLIIVANLVSPTETSATVAVLTSLGEGLLALVLIFVTGRWVLRPLFREIARFQSAELFTLTTLLVILGAAWLTHHMGLSLALGAFVAGIMLGETEYRHQLEAEIRPFRDVLMGLFLPDVWTWVLLLLSAMVVFKLLLVAGLCRLAGWDPAVSLRTGLILAHGGEFSFAILILALAGGLLPPDYGQVVLAALLISMALAALLIRFNGPLVAGLLPAAASASMETLRERVADTARGLNNHVIIGGYGRVGQNVARFLEAEGFRYLAMDMDPFRVENAVKARAPVAYGDAANIELLKAAGLSRAIALAFCLDNVDGVRKVLEHVRRLRPDLPVLVRTKDDALLEELQGAGATEVIPETMEASLMIASHLLFLLQVPVPKVLEHMHRVRSGRYALLRRLLPGGSDLLHRPSGMEPQSDETDAKGEE
ncbi:MAG: cation:proton antiporter [Gammaproteobacteria bacterium]